MNKLKLIGFGVIFLASFGFLVYGIAQVFMWVNEVKRFQQNATQVINTQGQQIQQIVNFLNEQIKSSR